MKVNEEPLTKDVSWSPNVDCRNDVILLSLSCHACKPFYTKR